MGNNIPKQAWGPKFESKRHLCKMLGVAMYVLVKPTFRFSESA